MTCPHCSKESPSGGIECPHCGLIFSKWRPPAQRSDAPETAGTNLWGWLILLAVAGGGLLYRAEYMAAPPPVHAATGSSIGAKAGGTVADLTPANFDSFVANPKVPALVMFYTDECPFCRACEAGLSRLAAESKGKYQVGRVNSDYYRDLQARYSGEGVPTFVFVHPGRADVVTQGAPGTDPEANYSELKQQVDSTLLSN